MIGGDGTGPDTTGGDTAGLGRFVAAQATTYDMALAELRDGRKVTHWMWFIFPQLAVLGRSATARFYGIANLAEAHAYLAHPLLGPRLLACAQALLLHEDLTAERILGKVDAAKLRSCATLFRAANPLLADSSAAMQALLDRFHAGQPCPLTLAALAAAPGGHPPMPDGG